MSFRSITSASVALQRAYEGCFNGVRDGHPGLCLGVKALPALAARGSCSAPWPEAMSWCRGSSSLAMGLTQGRPRVHPRHGLIFAWKKTQRQEKHRIPRVWEQEGFPPDKAMPYICFLLAAVNKPFNVFKSTNNKSAAVNKFSTPEKIRCNSCPEWHSKALSWHKSASLQSHPSADSILRWASSRALSSPVPKQTPHCSTTSGTGATATRRRCWECCSC